MTIEEQTCEISVSWKELYQFIYECGKEHDAYQFCGTVVEKLHSLIAYDQARVLFLSVSGKIKGSLLYGVRQSAWNTFMEYYLDDSFGSLYSLKKPLKLSEADRIGLCDWTDPTQQKKHKDFYENYVQPLKLKYCLGFGFSDIDNCQRVIITLDRTGSSRYTEEDIALLRMIRGQLENLFINMLVPAPKEFSAVPFISRQYHLTEREMEIAKLLCSGATPGNVAEKFSVSVTTIYKHVANMYKKLQISNRQELFAIFNSK